MMEHTMEFPVLKMVLSSHICQASNGHNRKALWVVRRGLEMLQCGQMERHEFRRKSSKT